MFLSTIVLGVKAQPVDTILNAPLTTGAAFRATRSIILAPGFLAKGLNGTFTFSIVTPLVVNCSPLNTVASSNQNYIQTLVPRKPFTDGTNLSSKNTCEVMQSIQYVDGLGRPLQRIQIKGNNDATKDVIQPIVYDAFGRESIKYLPYTDGTNTPGSYRLTALADQGVFYNIPPNGVKSIGIASAPIGFEPSPLNRVIEQGGPGTDWQFGGHTVKTVYVSNDGIMYLAKQFAVNIDVKGARTLIDNGNYGASQLYVTVSKNENWSQTMAVNVKLNTTEEYKNKQGQVVLSRTYNSNSTGQLETLSTYYVYDDFGNLAFVLPPGANPDNGLTSAKNQNELDNFCYQYGYDERKRMNSKKLPGKGMEYIVYNVLDQVVATQDANQRLKKQWMITKYDALGRVILTGTWTNNNTAILPQELKALVNAQSINWETRDNIKAFGYTQNNAYPTTLDNVLTVNFYDDYNLPWGNPFPYLANSNISVPESMPAAQSTMTKGLLTTSLTAILNGINNNVNPSNMLGTLYYYDDLGRLIQTNVQHYQGGIVTAANHDQVSNSYDFNNELVQSIRLHYNSTSTNPVVSIGTNYVYDHMGRKRQTWKQINNGPNILLVQNDYNEIGQELHKHLHSANNGSTFLQSITYGYNERGWLTNSTTDGNLFSQTLNYNSPVTGVTPQWNGNISLLSYNVNKGTDAGNHQFIYNYDALNRLTNAQSTKNLLDEKITYDKMGNIGSLIRSGGNEASMVYKYTDASGTYSNQLQSVSNKGLDFRSYTYDANGNTTSDGLNQTISYNLLNLPQSVGKGATIKATYVYDASANKLRNTGSDGTWDYINGIVYQNNLLSFIHSEEGRISYNQSTGVYNYAYDLKDHLGNTRVSFDKDPSTAKARVIQEDEYYSFGLRKNGGYDFSNNNRFLYNGKEIQTDLANQYDYGARFYDPFIGRWNSVDPKAEVFISLSPYNYVLNNPISFVDPDGEGPSDPPTFLQKLLAFFNVGPWNQPRGIEEIQESSKRQSALFASNERIERGADRIQETADWVPFLGAAMHLSKAGIDHSGKEAGIGFGMGMLDSFGGKLLGKGAKALSGAGKEILEKVIGKVGNISEHLTTKDMTGAIRDIFKDPVIINGKQYDHLGEVNDALKGLGNQIEKLNKAIKNGSFTDDILEQAQKLRSSLQKEKDKIQDILNKARKAANE
ncbi:RHS repeat-associated protein [Pedobacter cryoconitis]|uniref:DUF6443 domain-containing protein n=1 Tax=Pedobacter cryoconitis TaxID=188932 RepID=UPI001610715D|nr:DUF6443 domain-containing protein [Pedobacter cryoconitis]MBB6273364.1 RHS repeat-associated protein [Pedobacter cryoconitis]